ncbi:MAG: cupin domain-containing protein [Bacteroidales bacterium]
MSNLFDIKAFSDVSEMTETIFELSVSRVKLEHIVSFGHPTPEGEWYDQEESEWVALLSGSATLRYEDGSAICMVAGDHLIIRPHVRHRVEKVSEDAIWIALFIS